MNRTRKPAAAEPKPILIAPPDVAHESVHDHETGCLPAVPGAERFAAMVRTLSPDCMPSTREEVDQVAAVIADHWRRLPIATAIFLAVSRQRCWRDQDGGFNAWARERIGIESAAHVCHLVAVGEMIADAAAIVPRNNGGVGACTNDQIVPRNNGLHADLCALPYGKLIVLATLQRPHELVRFWEAYGARVLESSREEVREMVDEFRGVKPSKPHKIGRRSAVSRMEPSELIDCLAVFDPVRIHNEAPRISTSRAVAAFKNGLTVVDAQTRAGRYSTEELGELLRVVQDFANVIVPAARAAGYTFEGEDGQPTA
jgi:hypothetical protein